ncbi:MAG: hypothetical protein WD250_15855 [Egibacteraceae bacterium]
MTRPLVPSTSWWPRAWWPRRSEAVRLGLGVVVERHRRARIGTVIAQGYQRRPQTGAERGWADEATVAVIAEEAW